MYALHTALCYKRAFSCKYMLYVEHTLPTMPSFVLYRSLVAKISSAVYMHYIFLIYFYVT